MPQTIIDLGQAVKKQYPDTPEYQKLTDAELGAAYKKAYPDSYSQFSDITSNAKLTETKPSLSDTVLEIVKGAASGSPILHGIQAVKDYWTKNSTNDKLQDLSDITQHGAAAAVGALAGIGSANPAAASFGMAGTEAVLNKVKGQQNKTILGSVFPSKDPKNDTIKATLEGTIENEAGSKILEGAGGLLTKTAAGIKEAISPGSVVGPELANNTKTFSQLADKGKRSAAKVVEDIFAPTDKAAAIHETNQVLQKKLEDQTSNLAKQPIDLSANAQDTTRNLASTQQAILNENFGHSIAASNQKADAIHIIAQQNNPAKLAPSALVTAGTPKLANIDGPIYLKDTIDAAQNYLNDAQKGLINDDPDNPLIKAATKIIATAGDASNPQPVSFKQVWQWKKDAGDLAFGSPKSDVNVTDSKFSKIFETIDNDVESSMKQWPNNGTKAAELWNDTKRIVANRYEQFQPKGELGVKVKDLLNAKDVQIDKLDAIIQDPPKLQRLLNSGDLVGLLTGDKNTPVSSIANTNTRSLLKGYGISRIWQNGTSLNSDGVAVPDPTKMYNLWKGAENSTSMKMIYSAQNRADISQFFKELANVNQKTTGGGSIYLKFRAAAAGLSLVGGVADSIITHGSVLPITKGEAIGGLVSGIILGAHQVGKLLTNKNTARIMQGMAQSQLSVPAKFAARAITYALRNQFVQVQTSSGKLIPAKIDQNGNVQIGETK